MIKEYGKYKFELRTLTFKDEMASLSDLEEMKITDNVRYKVLSMSRNIFYAIQKMYIDGRDCDKNIEFEQIPLAIMGEIGKDVSTMNKFEEDVKKK